MSKISFLDIVQAELMAHNITLCQGCSESRQSHSRGYAWPDKREIHYSAKCSTRSTLYGFLHEVGHIVKGHGKSCKLKRWQEEQEAERYAFDSMRAYGIPVPRKTVARGRGYIARKKRHGQNIIAGRRSV